MVESYGYGHTTLSNKDGHYTQRKLQIVHLDDQGKVDHFRVYFSPLCKFNSMKQSIPSFPYFNYWPSAPFKPRDAAPNNTGRRLAVSFFGIIVSK